MMLTKTYSQLMLMLTKTYFQFASLNIDNRMVNIQKDVGRGDDSSTRPQSIPMGLIKDMFKVYKTTVVHNELLPRLIWTSDG